VAGEQHLPAAAEQQRDDGKLFVVAAPAPLRRIVVRQEDVVQVQEHAVGQAGNDTVQQEIDVAARHQNVAGVDEQDVAGGEVGKGRETDVRHRRPHGLDGQRFDRGARRRVDGGDAGGQSAVVPGAREEAGGVAGADLDDPGRPAATDGGIGDGGVEAREPVLVPARGRRRGDADGGEIGRERGERRARRRNRPAP
jgi:hypothetical protein